MVPRWLPGAKLVWLRRVFVVEIIWATTSRQVVVVALLGWSKMMLMVSPLLRLVQELAHEEVEVFVGHVGDILLAQEVRLVVRKMTLVVVERHF